MKPQYSRLFVQTGTRPVHRATTGSAADVTGDGETALAGVTGLPVRL